MQVNLRKAFADAMQHFFVPLDLQVRMQAALHEHAGAAEFHRLADLVVDRFEFEDVSFFRRRPLQRPVKRAEGAVLGTEIRIVNIAVNDVGDHALGMQLAAHAVRFHADADQVIGTEHLDGLLLG